MPNATKPFAMPVLDLAVEASSLARGQANIEIKGVVEKVRHFEHATVTTIEVNTPEGAEQMRKPMGSYITIESPDMGLDKELLSPISGILAERLQSLLPEHKKETILLIGLGNRQATPDSLGPMTINFLMPTRHLFQYMPEAISENELSSICTVCPSVLGMTGIETAEIIKGIVSYVKPACLLVIDALAAASLSRISTTIQISDTGINPGSGVGNHRNAINKESMGVPVIAIGVPTVVHAATIMQESLKEFSQAIQLSPSVNWQNARDTMLDHMLSPFNGNLVVTPKDIDQLNFNTAKILAAGLTRALHPGVNGKNFYQYLQ